MLARLGNVFYWIGCGIAALMAIYAGSILVYARQDQALVLSLIIAALIGGCAFLTGWAIRYVLSGR